MMTAGDKTDQEAALEREFDVFSTRAAIVVPANMREQMLDDFRELHRMLKVLRVHLKPEDQPNETFRMQSGTRAV